MKGYKNKFYFPPDRIGQRALSPRSEFQTTFRLAVVRMSIVSSAIQQVMGCGQQNKNSHCVGNDKIITLWKTFSQKKTFFNKSRYLK